MVYLQTKIAIWVYFGGPWNGKIGIILVPPLFVEPPFVEPRLIEPPFVVHRLIEPPFVEPPLIERFFDRTSINRIID
jgi:hypothetical protein